MIPISDNNRANHKTHRCRVSAWVLSLCMSLLGMTSLAGQDGLAAPQASEALREAVLSNKAEEVRKVLEAGEPAGAVMEFRGEAGVPILSVAVLTGRAEVARMLRDDFGARMPDKHRDALNSLLDGASSFRKEALGFLALEFGAEIRDHTLFSASKARGFDRLMTTLIEGGAPLDWKNGDGATAFDVAVKFGNLSGAKVLLEAGADPLLGHWVESLYASLRRGDVEVADAIMNAEGFALDADTATRLLGTTVYFSQLLPEHAGRFLALGADPSLCDASNKIRMSTTLLTLEELAEFRTRSLHDVFRAAGHVELGEQFVAKAVGVNRRRADGDSELTAAAKAGDVGAVEKLIKEGAWLELPDAAEGRPPLLWAAVAGHAEVVDLLLESAAHPEATDTSGESALTLAIRAGNAAMVGRLLNAGARPVAAAEGAVSPVELARSLGEASVIEVLEGGIKAAEAAVWSEDFEAAKARAEAQGSPMLLLFTGSDWCGFCVMLERDVLEQHSFLSQIGERVPLVRLDYPRRKKQEAAVVERNAELKKKYGDDKGNLGFPTLVLVKPDGTELVRRAGYSPSDKAAWLAWLGATLEEHVAR